MKVALYLNRGSLLKNGNQALGLGLGKFHKEVELFWNNLGGLCILSALLLTCLIAHESWGSNSKENPGVGYQDLVKNLQSQAEFFKLQEMQTGHGKYNLIIHNARVSKLIKSEYKNQELSELVEALKSVMRINVRENGLVQAADRDLSSQEDPTHYDAIWLRDSLWIYLGVKAQGVAAKKILLKMWDYLASENQIKRFQEVIRDPKPMMKSNGAMLAVHIRFDGKSSDFNDIMVDGKPQTWNHKQNDALGLFYDLALRAVEEGEINWKELSDNHLKVVALVPAYMKAIKYWEFPDAGSWEEIERTNTSSIALVTSGLENLYRIWKRSKSDKNLGELFQKMKVILGQEKEHASTIFANLNKVWDANEISKLVDQGYLRIRKQLKAGGESPLYAKNMPEFRTADAALLNLIYPARLSRLKSSEKENILKIIEPLIGEIGIRRYLKDSYQCGNFWFSPTEMADKTADSSSASDFAARARQFIKDSEAQWFFDSWYSKAAGILYLETKNVKYKQLQIQFLNRSLAQITGAPLGQKVWGADGRTVKEFELPESYNQIIPSKPSGELENRYFVASPITPLNWAKASLAISLEEVRKSSIESQSK